MTMPLEYARASQDFDAFVEDLRGRLGHETRHQTYQTIESVLRVFRRRLTLEQIAIFGNVLPAVLRAIFYEEWRPHDANRPFDDMAALNAEVHDRRRNHDFSPDTAIEDFAAVLRRHVDPLAFRSALDKLPDAAARFWGTRADS